jgi:hypothetical protein
VARDASCAEFCGFKEFQRSYGADDLEGLVERFKAEPDLHDGDDVSTEVGTSATAL